MKTLIVYASSNGCTETCSEKLAEALPDSPQLANIKKSRQLNLENFDTILIGGSIYAGRIQGAIKKFCDKNLEELKHKQIGLFLCCMEEGETAVKQFESAYPEELRKHAIAKGLFGGEFNFEKMNFVQKAIIKKIAKTDKSISKISEENIAEFIQSIKSIGI